MQAHDPGALALLVANTLILGYFLLLQGSYLILLLISSMAILRYRHIVADEHWRSIIQSPLTLPISLIAPAYNEERTIIESVRSLLSLEYPEYEVIVVNDGSRDSTLATLIEHFQLQPIPARIEYAIPCQPIRHVYRSARYPRLVVVDKENGGKADALNAGIIMASHPLFCAMDADSLLEGNALLRITRPFLEHPETVAVGGIVRIANGCQVEQGKVKAVGLSRNPLVIFQHVEYLRAFLFGRVGWSALGALLIISGAFGVFKRQAVLDAGGYRHDTVGEDFELVVRMHRRLREQKRAYRIVFLPDPVCWTEAPETLRVLGRQRNRWQRGLIDTLKIHRRMTLNPRYGRIGMVAMPYFVIIELIGPVIEMFGYLFVTMAFLLKLINLPFFLLFLTLAILLGALLSVASVTLDEIAYHRFPRLSQLLILVAFALLEQFGYRQLTVWWRIRAFVDYWRGNKSWGTMERKGFARPRA
ncbi:MAG: glycosyltransferase [Oscillochloridaceae bacterium]|nr:glycosyltransferase family 2 protein [Chloroflexaceae bacterium]MDW8390332.1 glycosyltransferase [Oscillochloridaceae bacterium]